MARDNNVTLTANGTVATDCDKRGGRGKRIKERFKNATDPANVDALHVAERKLKDKGKIACSARDAGRTGRGTRAKNRPVEVTISENNSVATDFDKRVNRGTRVEKRL